MAKAQFSELCTENIMASVHRVDLARSSDTVILRMVCGVRYAVNQIFCHGECFQP